MKKMLFAGAAALAALVATGAQAASTETGWYGALDAGVHKTKPITSTATDLNNTAIGYDWNWGTEQSWAGFARLGYRMTPHVRVELEGGYRQGNLSSVLSKTGSASIPAGLCAAGVIRTSAAPTCGKPSGHINRYTVMLNGLYDFMPDAYVNPFIGAGVGVGSTDASVNGQFAKIPTGGGAAIQNLTSSSTKSSITYQMLAGLAWHPMERVSVDLTYRYLNGSDVKFTTTGSGALQPGKFHGPYEDNSVTIGVRYSFAAPPPPPPRRRRRLPRRLRLPPRRLRRLRLRLRRPRLKPSSSWCTSPSISRSSPRTRKRSCRLQPTMRCRAAPPVWWSSVTPTPRVR